MTTFQQQETSLDHTQSNEVNFEEELKYECSRLGLNINHPDVSLWILTRSDFPHEKAYFYAATYVVNKIDSIEGEMSLSQILDWIGFSKEMKQKLQSSFDIYNEDSITYILKHVKSITSAIECPLSQC